MKPIADRLFVGSQNDYESVFFDDNFSFCLAAKNPFHKDAIGYTGKSCSKEHPEYLWCYRDRGSKLILNMVDAPSSLFFDKGMVDEALNFIEEELFKDRNVLIACNAGQSRSASLGLLFLIRQGHIKGDTLEDCEAEFMKVYPQYNPGTGMRGFVKQHWMEYMYSDCIIGIDLGKGNSKTGFAKKLHNRMKHINPELFKKEYLAEFTKVDEETEKAIEENFSDGHLKEHWKEYL